MIFRLKRKVIILTTVSLFALLVVIVSGMNIISFISLAKESDEILGVITEFGGRFPDTKENMPERQDSETAPKDFPRRFSEELQFETRYFSVVMTNEGDTVRTDTGRIAAVDTDGAVDFAKQAVESDKSKGFINNYRYIITKDDDNNVITFLDCTRKLESFRTFLLSSTMVSFAGFVIVSVIIVIISGKIIRPIAESYEKQKRFITDAGHELKTPLAIINANVELIEDEVSDKESIQDIKAQTKRLENLTDDLITLSRMEEGASAIIKAPFDASKTAKDMLSGFKALAASKGTNLAGVIPRDIVLNGDKNAFEKLLSIILDNAVKYTPDGENIEFTLKKTDKSVVVACKNSTVSEQNRECVSHVFDRFYRTDSSRNSETGGHGIGLSVAKAIVEAHGGKITACVPDKNIFSVTATLPL